MKYTSLEAWHEAASSAGYTVKQVQGFEQYEARDGDTVVGSWNHEGELPDPPLVDEPGVEP